MEKVTSNEKEQRRLKMLILVIEGTINRRQAAEVLGLSLRHAKRLSAGYREEGAAAFAHGNTDVQNDSVITRINAHTVAVIERQ
jgi:hypothetical protein